MGATRTGGAPTPRSGRGGTIPAQGEEMTGGVNRTGRTTEVEMENFWRWWTMIRSGIEMLRRALTLRMLSRSQRVI